MCDFFRFFFFSIMKALIEHSPHLVLGFHTNRFKDILFRVDLKSGKIFFFICCLRIAISLDHTEKIVVLFFFLFPTFIVSQILERLTYFVMMLQICQFHSIH